MVQSLHSALTIELGSGFFSRQINCPLSAHKGRPNLVETVDFTLILEH